MLGCGVSENGKMRRNFKMRRERETGSAGHEVNAEMVENKRSHEAVKRET